MMGAALSPRFGPRNAGALALAGSVLLGAHRAAHMLYRFAALEIGGVACMGAVFAAARDHAPCVVLLDQIDTLGRPRGDDTTTEGSMDRVVAMLLLDNSSQKNMNRCDM